MRGPGLHSGQALAGMQLSADVAEELILPTLRAVENDLYPSAATPSKSRIYRQLRELIQEMTVDLPWVYWTRIAGVLTTANAEGAFRPKCQALASTLID